VDQPHLAFVVTLAIAITLTLALTFVLALSYQAELSVNFVDFIVAPFFMALTSLLPKVHECCSLMRENRAMWHTRVLEEIKSSSGDGGGGGGGGGDDSEAEAKREEAVTRWKRREVAFEQIVNPLIEQATNQVGELLQIIPTPRATHHAQHTTTNIPPPTHHHQQCNGAGAGEG
jgi:hypothetical protein